MDLSHGPATKTETDCGRCGASGRIEDLRRCAFCRQDICSDCRGSDGDAVKVIYFCNTADSSCWEKVA